MYSTADYLKRGARFLNNNIFPGRKKLSTLMIYATDLCDSACKHCLIWTKRPVKFLSRETIIKIMQSDCITHDTMIGLEGGEFLLHPEAFEILEWFYTHHKNYDLLSNCLKPEQTIRACELYPPQRLYVSLDGTQETYADMRGKDGYPSVLKVIEALHNKVPISVMFTLSPYNNFSDMKHVAEVCRRYHIDMRVGVYNNIAFFDTIDAAHNTDIGTKKNGQALSFGQVMKMNRQQPGSCKQACFEDSADFSARIPDIVREFSENYDFLLLYNEWRSKHTQLKCYSIMDSLVVLPNGDVPICQNLDVLLGNVHNETLDVIFNSKASINTQKHHRDNCNGCWINFHRKYDVVLYRNFEKFFGRYLTSKMLGFYQWEADKAVTYKQLVNKY